MLHCGQKRPSHAAEDMERNQLGKVRVSQTHLKERATHLKMLAKTDTKGAEKGTKPRSPSMIGRQPREDTRKQAASPQPKKGGAGSIESKQSKALKKRAKGGMPDCPQQGGRGNALPLTQEGAKDVTPGPQHARSACELEEAAKTRARSTGATTSTIKRESEARCPTCRRLNCNGQVTI